MDSSAILKYFVNFILPRIINECDLNSQNSVIVQWNFFFFPGSTSCFSERAGRCLQDSMKVKGG